ncbi:MAG: hypothetical protein JSV50_20955, partial [Desulfobacteraceae bacterium]
FKFCYVDVTKRTDVMKVFGDYQNTMSLLKETFPKTIFAHLTVPLTCKEAGIKGWVRKGKNLIKKVIGKTVFNYFDNIKREQFNEMVRQEYDGKEPVFDLAKIESTFYDGKRSSFTKDGETYYSLVSEYTHDGGHLNEKGRRIVAEQLLILLANLSE